MAEPQYTISIYTDGACIGNPGPGGYAALLIAVDEAGKVIKEREVFGGEPDTTNNRMELRAAIGGLETLTRASQVTIYTDSEYVKKGITEWLPGWVAKGWQTSGKKPVKNQDLWQRLHELTQQHEVTWQWVKGHAGHIYNERVDTLSVREAEKHRR